MRMLIVFLSLILLTGCWPSSVSFVDSGSMPPEWKTFYVHTMSNSAPNVALSYPAALSEAIKDGVQNNTRLLLNNTADKAEVEIQGTIISYSITPIALQEGDNASQNRLNVSVNFEIIIHAPEEREMKMVSTRFIDYNSNTDLATVETQLLEEVNTQIVQDVINKLLSNW